MSQLEESRLAWQRAQADFQSAIAELEKSVASNADAASVEQARAEAGRRQATADELLHRYITYLGKAQDT
jgi:hypothetical protein